MNGGAIEMLRLNVDRIPDAGLVVRADAPVERFSGLQDVCRQEAISFSSPIRLEIKLRRISGLVEAAGTIHTTVALVCSRCLAPFSQDLDIDFEAVYGEDLPDPAPAAGDGDIELTPEAMDVFSFHGRQVDLSEAIQEQVLLALPVRPLCREDCRGLCSTCGADLNQGRCGCAEKPVDPRFAALKNLKLTKG